MNKFEPSLRVIQNWDASYTTSFRARVGDTIVLTDRTDCWDGYRWIWATDPDGRSGWIPDSLVTQTNGIVTVSQDFDAKELTCERGELLGEIQRTHGWVLCRNDNGAMGWVPERNLTSVDEA